MGDNGEVGQKYQKRGGVLCERPLLEEKCKLGKNVNTIMFYWLQNSIRL